MNHDVLDPVRREMSELCGLPLQQTTTMITTYIDDIFIATYTIEQHLMLLEILFNTLAHLRVTVNILKSFIGKRSVHLLGSTIDGQT